MALLTESDAQAILKKVMSYSQADGCEANLNGNIGGNIRYARNSVSTSGATSDTTLVVQSNFGQKMGTATINEFDEASLKKVVRRSEELAKLAPDNPEFMDILGPQKYLKTKAFFNSTAEVTPEYRAQAAANSIQPCKQKDLVAAGFLQDNASFQSIQNSAGLSAYFESTNVNFSVTVRTSDGKGSGWALRDFNDVQKLDTKTTSQVAMDKALMSKAARGIEPGKYPVILEPAASIGLLQNMMFNMAARRADEGRSFFTKEGGGTKIGEKIVDERVTIYSDPTDLRIPVSPWPPC